MTEEANIQAPEDPFPSSVFSIGKQNAILGHTLIASGESFFAQCYGRVKAAWFLDAYNGKLWRYACDFFSKHKRRPKPEELRDYYPIMQEDLQTQTRIRAQLNLALQATSVHGLDVLRPDLTEWMHARLFKAGVEKAQAIYNNAVGLKEDSDKKRALLASAYGVMKDTVKQIDGTTFEEDLEERLGNWRTDFATQEEEYVGALSFGYSVFDQQLTPKSSEIAARNARDAAVAAGMDRIQIDAVVAEAIRNSGSLLRGDTTILLAPTNAGKTTCMITVAIHNVKKGKHVLFITHEGRPSDIKEKLWCCYLGIPPTHPDRTADALYNLYKTPEGAALLDMAVKEIDKYLTYIPMNKAGLTVEEVGAVVRKKQEELMACNMGRGYDLLVDDYPAKLTVSGADARRLSRREKDDDVYNYFVQLGLEFKFHVLCAIQTNREGSRVNAGEGGADRLLRMEDVMESWGPMTAATNVISINRDPLAEAKGRVTFYICKSRSSEKGIAVVCRSKYGHSITHSESLGGTWYRGTTTMPDKIDGLLEQFYNKGIPVDKSLAA